MTTDQSQQQGVSAQAQLAVAIGDLAAVMKTEQQRQQRLAQGIHPFFVSVMPITLSAGAGTLNQPNLCGPQTGKYWDVHRIQCTGFTAGTVTVYLGQQNAESLAIFSTAGILLNGKAQIILGGADNMVFVAASITGSVSVSFSGTEIDAACIGDYLA